MTVAEFHQTLKDPAPPKVFSLLLKALWHDAQGNWDIAHQLIQNIQDKDAAWIHAYLHRKEGDELNARYWYRRAGREIPDSSLNTEWDAMVQHFLS